MSRFKQEISGSLGNYWKNKALQEIKEAVQQANQDAILDDNKAILWKTNKMYLMDDFCEKLEYAGYDFDRKATQVAREKQISKQFEEYRKIPHVPTDEELAEMRNAFGTGTKIIDVISGEEYEI